jgi:hypothetical protein
VGRNKEFLIRLSLRSLPLLPGFAWRNELMIEAGQRKRQPVGKNRARWYSVLCAWLFTAGEPLFPSRVSEKA